MLPSGSHTSPFLILLQFAVSALILPISANNGIEPGVLVDNISFQKVSGPDDDGFEGTSEAAKIDENSASQLMLAPSGVRHGILTRRRSVRQMVARSRLHCIRLEEIADEFNAQNQPSNNSLLYHFGNSMGVDRCKNSKSLGSIEEHHLTNDLFKDPFNASFVVAKAKPLMGPLGDHSEVKINRNLFTVAFYIYLAAMPECSEAEKDLNRASILRLIDNPDESYLRIAFCRSKLYVTFETKNWAPEVHILDLPTEPWVAEQWQFLSISVATMEGAYRQVNAHSSSGNIMASSNKNMSDVMVLDTHGPLKMLIGQGESVLAMFCLTIWAKVLDDIEISRLPYFCWNDGDWNYGSDKGIPALNFYRYLRHLPELTHLVGYWRLIYENNPTSALEDVVSGLGPSYAKLQMIPLNTAEPGYPFTSTKYLMMPIQPSDSASSPENLIYNNLSWPNGGHLTISFLYYTTDASRTLSDDTILALQPMIGRSLTIKDAIQLRPVVAGLEVDAKGDLRICRNRTGYRFISLAFNGSHAMAFDLFGVQFAITKFDLDFVPSKNNSRASLRLLGNEKTSQPAAAIACLSIYYRRLAAEEMRRLYCLCVSNGPCPLPESALAPHRPCALANMTTFWLLVARREEADDYCSLAKDDSILRLAEDKLIEKPGPWNHKSYTTSSFGMPMVKYFNRRLFDSFTVTFFFHPGLWRKCPRNFPNENPKMPFSTIYRFGHHAPSFEIVFCNDTLHAVIHFDTNDPSVIGLLDVKTDNWHFVALVYEEGQGIAVFGSTGVLRKQVPFDGKLQLPRDVIVSHSVGNLANGDRLFCFVEFGTALSPKDVARMRCFCRYNRACPDDKPFDLVYYSGPKKADLVGFWPLVESNPERVEVEHGFDEVARGLRMTNLTVALPFKPHAIPFNVEVDLQFYQASVEYRFLEPVNVSKSVTISFFRYIQRGERIHKGQMYMQLVAADGSPALQVFPEKSSKADGIWTFVSFSGVIEQTAVGLRIGPYLQNMTIFCLHIHSAVLSQQEVEMVKCGCQVVGTNCTFSTQKPVPLARRQHPKIGCVKGLQSPSNEFLKSYVSFDKDLFGMDDVCVTNRQFVAPDNVATIWREGPPLSWNREKHATSSVTIPYERPDKVTLQEFDLIETWQVRSFTLSFFIFVPPKALMSSDDLSCSPKSDHGRSFIFEYNNTLSSEQYFKIGYCYGGFIVFLKSSLVSKEAQFLFLVRATERFEGWNMFVITGTVSEKEWKMEFYTQSGELIDTFLLNNVFEAFEFDYLVIGRLRSPLGLSCVTRFSTALTPVQITALPRFCCVQCEKDRGDGSRVPWIKNEEKKDELVAAVNLSLIELNGYMPALDDRLRKVVPTFLQPIATRPSSPLIYKLNAKYSRELETKFQDYTKLNFFYAAKDRTPVAVYENVLLGCDFSILLTIYVSSPAESEDSQHLFHLSSTDGETFISFSERADFIDSPDIGQLEFIGTRGEILIKRQPTSGWLFFVIEFQMWARRLTLLDETDRELQHLSYPDGVWDDGWCKDDDDDDKKKQFILTLGPYRSDTTFLTVTELIILTAAGQDQAPKVDLTTQPNKSPVSLPNVATSSVTAIDVTTIKGNGGSTKFRKSKPALYWINFFIAVFIVCYLCDDFPMSL